MNALEMNHAPIIAALAEAGEASARQIATETGLEPLDVTKALNRMLKSAEIEREKRKGEYVYWLCADAKMPAQDKIKEPVDPSYLDVVECAEKAAQMIDDGADEISKLQLQIEAKDADLLAYLGQVGELRARIEAQVKQHAAECGHLADKNAALHAQIDHLRADKAAHPGFGAALAHGTPIGFAVIAADGKTTRHKSRQAADATAASAVRRTGRTAQICTLTRIARIKRGLEIEGDI